MKKFIAALSALALLASCANSDPVREALLKRSGNLPDVSNVVYDEVFSTTTSLALFWENAAAIEAGVITFTVQLCDDEYFYEGDASTVTSYTVKVTDYPNDGIVINGLKAGQQHYVRVAATYPGPTRTAWVNLCNSKGLPVAVIPGQGIVE